jgi:hypothetical protein
MAAAMSYPRALVVMAWLVGGGAWLGGLGGEGVARAERRTVAVVDLAGDPRALTVAAGLGDALIDHNGLQPLGDPSVAAALLGPIAEEDSARLQAAERARGDALDLLAQFDVAAAASRALAGQAELLDVGPSPAALALYADLAFALGQARLADRQPQAAAAAFALTHRLAPGRKLELARYLPEVVQAFEAAVTPPAGRGAIEIRGHGRIWLDGREVGVAPLTQDAPVGSHLVQLAGDDRLARGAAVEVAVGASAVVELPDAPAPLALQAARDRRAVQQAGDPAARAAAIGRLAARIGVGDVVLVARDGDALVIQTWRDRAPGLSRPRELGSATALELLEPLAPPVHRIVIEPLPPVVLPSPPPPPWFRQPWVQGSVVAGVVAAAVGIFVATRPPSTISYVRGTSW